MYKKKLQQKVVEDNFEVVDTNQLLQKIQQKIDGAAALNGGFDKLLYKIDGIEKSQSEIVEKVDKIHEAIYHPDDGLFSRITSNKIGQIESVSKIEKQFVETVVWKNQLDIASENCEKETKELQLKLQKVETSIITIEKMQAMVFSSMKWIGAAAGGGIITFILKLFYNLVKITP